MINIEKDSLALFSAMAGLIAAVGGAFAAVAAFRSAGIARAAAKHAQQVEHRELVRDVIGSAQSIIAESMRIDDLGNKLKLGYADLSTFSGQAGGSRERMLIQEIEQKQQGVRTFQREALESIENQKSLRVLSEEELTDLLIKYEGRLVQTRRVKEKFEHDLASVEGEIRVWKERAIKNV